jgi:hypothetical protein
MISLNPIFTLAGDGALRLVFDISRERQAAAEEKA